MVLQASSTGREVSYIGLAQSLACRVQMAKATCKCGNPGTEMVGCMEPYEVGWSEVVGNSRARFRTACDFAQVAAGVGNASRLSR